MAGEEAVAVLLFPSVGMFLIFLAIAVLIFGVARALIRSMSADGAVEEKLCAFEEGTLDQLAKKKNLDLNKIILVRENREFPKSFRRKLREQLSEEMFPEKEKDKK